MNAEEQEKEKEEKQKISESIERLSLMIRFNHRGSLTSLSGKSHNFIVSYGISIEPTLDSK
jgi:hypothetical protein